PAMRSSSRMRSSQSDSSGSNMTSRAWPTPFATASCPLSSPQLLNAEALPLRPPPRQRRDSGHPGAIALRRTVMTLNTQAFFRGKSVLITGASSGIGEELAWQLSQAGAQLTLAARRADLLDKLAQRIISSGQPSP